MPPQTTGTSERSLTIRDALMPDVICDPVLAVIPTHSGLVASSFRSRVCQSLCRFISTMETVKPSVTSGAESVTKERGTTGRMILRAYEPTSGETIFHLPVQ